MATRELTGAFEDALDDAVFSPFYAVELGFAEGEVRFWTGYGDLVVGGDTYTGLGNLLDISYVEETSDLSARGVTLTLSGIPSSLLSLALTSTYQGRQATLFFGAYSPNGEVLSGGLINVFTGYMDQMNIYEDGETATIELMIENKLIDLERPRRARYSKDYQQSVYPDDLGFNYIADLQDKEIPWGRKVD